MEHDEVPVSRSTSSESEHPGDLVLHCGIRSLKASLCIISSSTSLKSTVLNPFQVLCAILEGPHKHLGLGALPLPVENEGGPGGRLRLFFLIPHSISFPVAPAGIRWSYSPGRVSPLQVEESSLPFGAIHHPLPVGKRALAPPLAPF